MKTYVVFACQNEPKKSKVKFLNDIDFNFYDSSSEPTLFNKKAIKNPIEHTRFLTDLCNFEFGNVAIEENNFKTWLKQLKEFAKSIKEIDAITYAKHSFDYLIYMLENLAKCDWVMAEKIVISPIKFDAEAEKFGEDFHSGYRHIASAFAEAAEFGAIWVKRAC